MTATKIAEKEIRRGMMAMENSPTGKNSRSKKQKSTKLLLLILQLAAL